MAATHAILASLDERCPNGCGPLTDKGAVAVCDECGYYTNVTRKHLKMEIAQALGLPAQKDD